MQLGLLPGFRLKELQLLEILFVVYLNMELWLLSDDSGFEFLDPIHTPFSQYPALHDCSSFTHQHYLDKTFHHLLIRLAIFFLNVLKDLEHPNLRMVQTNTRPSYDIEVINPQVIDNQVVYSRTG